MSELEQRSNGTRNGVRRAFPSRAVLENAEVYQAAVSGAALLCTRRWLVRVSMLAVLAAIGGLLVYYTHLAGVS